MSLTPLSSASTEEGMPELLPYSSDDDDIRFDTVPTLQAWEPPRVVVSVLPMPNGSATIFSGFDQANMLVFAFGFFNAYQPLIAP